MCSSATDETSGTSGVCPKKRSNWLAICTWKMMRNIEKPWDEMGYFPTKPWWNGILESPPLLGGLALSVRPRLVIQPTNMQIMQCLCVETPKVARFWWISYGPPQGREHHGTPNDSDSNFFNFSSCQCALSLTKFQIALPRNCDGCAKKWLPQLYPV